MNTSSLSSLARAKFLCFGGCATLLAVSSLAGQTSYTVVDLSAASGQYGMAYGTSGGQAAGAASSSPQAYVGAPSVSLVFPRAALWTGDGTTDLHPGTLLGGDPSNSGSAAYGFAGSLEVGMGYGPNTQSRGVALAWHDTAARAAVLPVPFAASGSAALATDGAQIVGWAQPTTGKQFSRALLWNAATGAATDLGDAGNGGAFAVAVARGQQVGYTSGGGKGSAAVLWNGTAKSLTVLHPKNADYSQATATDGARQVGFSSISVKAPGEPGNHGPVTVSYSSATLWKGTAASAQNMGSPFDQSYALGISGNAVVGYGYNGKGVGAYATYHALVWNATTFQTTDLNAFLPAGFTGAMATGVDAAGNVSGTIITPDGLPHAAVWLPNP